MNKKLIKLILAGNNRFNIDCTVTFIGTNQDLFDDLVEIMLHSNKPIPQRAAWVMTVVIDNYPWLLKNQLNLLIDSMQYFKHPALARCFLRALCVIDIPDDKMGLLYEKCHNYLFDTKQPAAIRVFALQVMYNISEKEPELKFELKLIIESQIINSTAGLQNRGGKLLEKLNKYLKSK